MEDDTEQGQEVDLSVTEQALVRALIASIVRELSAPEESQQEAA